jgi:WD repeat-containing protein 23
MSSARPVQDILSEEDDPHTVTYDPNDPFWHDAEDGDDMDYVPAPGESDDDEGISFHGIYRNSG